MLDAPPPPRLEDYRAGAVLFAGLGTSVVLPDADFETRSEAGFVWNDAACAWDGPPNAPQNRKGLSVVGAAVYAQHPTTDVLSFKYDLKDGQGARWWRPGMPNPQELFDHLAAGGLLEAWNSGFEHWIWNHVCVPRYGWPPLPLRQLRCAMAKARAFAVPGALDNASDVLRLAVRKDKDGKRLLDKFSIPRKPTKGDPRRWITPAEDPDDATRLYTYNEIDIRAEAEASSKCPDLTPDELEFWLCDQEINYRGVAVDAPAVANCIAVIEQAFSQYNAELHRLTNGAVEKASQLERMKGWLIPRGVYAFSLDEEGVAEILARDDIDDDARRVLEIRGLIGSASIKKLFAMRNQMTDAHRLHDLFSFHVARTGRAAGNGPQPHNLPKSGPDVYNCTTCNHFYGTHRFSCPWCFTVAAPGQPKLEWTADCHDDALLILSSRDLTFVEAFFGDACQLVLGCLRGLFIAGDGHDLIASDYSAIEAVVLAALAGEQWRLDTFAERRDIYLASAAHVTGNTYEFYIDYRLRTGKHHPHRQPFGKVLELALGYGGWTGAMINFGAEEFFTIPEMVEAIKAWRAASPAIVEFWGGQFRGLPWDRNPPMRAEYFGLEGAAIQAILNPGREFTVLAPHAASRPVTYVVRGDKLFCILPSGRPLTYHSPRLTTATKGPYKGEALSIVFMGWNTNPKMGAIGWVQMDTYGPKLAENVVQAVARDVLRDAIVRTRHAGYPTVLHVHDEIVWEVPKGWGSVEEAEGLMSKMNPWAAGWEVFLRAVGGWRGRRYRKD